MYYGKQPSDAERDRLLKDAKANGSGVLRLAQTRPGGTHGRRKKPRGPQKRAAIRSQED